MRTLTMSNLKAFFTKYKSKIVLGIVAIVALSLPFVINQVLKQQDIRQRANTAPSITFSLVPATKTIGIGDYLDVDLVMNAGTNDIGGLQFNVQYNSPSNLIQFVSVLSQPTGLQSITQQDTNGTISITMINPNITPVTGNGVKIITFRFKALSAGNPKITIDSIKATATGFDTYVPIDNAANIIGSYTIANSTVDTNCNATTNKPASCECAVDADCASGSCIVNTTGSNQDRPAKICAANPTITVSPSITGCATQVLCTQSEPPTGCHFEGRDSCSCGTIVCTSPTVTTTATTSPSVTPTQIPTVTLAPGETGLKLSLTLPGISKRNGENDHPLRTRRIVKVTVYDSTSQESVVVAEKTGPVDFNPTTAKYEGSVGIGTTIATGNYIVKVRMDNTLKKRLPGTVHVTQGTADNSTPTVELVTGDLDQDNALGVQDYTNVMACYNHLSACTGDILVLGDLDDDGVTNGDNDDINIMQFNTINRQGD